MRRFLTACVVWLALLTPAFTQVVFDAQSTTDKRVSTTNTSSDTNLTVGSLSNRALVVQVAFDSSGGLVTVTGVHWDALGTNQALTFIVGVSNANVRVELWGYANSGTPLTSGNKTLKVDWSGTVVDGFTTGVAYSGVDQTGGTTSFAHSNTGTGTNNAVTLNITSATNNAVVGVLNTFLANIVSMSGTTVFIDNLGGASSAGGNRDVGAATVTLTSSPNNTWAMAGVDVVAASGAAAATPMRTLMGVGQ